MLLAVTGADPDSKVRGAIAPFAPLRIRPCADMSNRVDDLV